MDMEIDPDIAAQMGFSSFGGPAKKRRIGADDAFTGIEQPTGQPKQTQKQSSGANATGLGERKPAKAVPDAPSATASTPASVGEMKNTQALRRGVRNENGDMAYFLPSFLEDPWERLRANST